MDTSYINYVTKVDNENVLYLMVEGIHCGGCIVKIERELKKNQYVTYARLNLSTKRLVVKWRGKRNFCDEIVKTIRGLGYETVFYSGEQILSSEKNENNNLLKALAVAGFAGANVMLLSVAVWAGYFENMDFVTRHMLHWFSALIALPTIFYSGMVFFKNAYRALRNFTTNMDVPISVGVILATLVSLLETIKGGKYVYFDSAIMLLFFLLIGRYLEHRARGKARQQASNLLAFKNEVVTIIGSDNKKYFLPQGKVEKDMVVLVESGNKILVDGVLMSGEAEIDDSLISGEMLPKKISKNEKIFAGMINIGNPIKIKVTKIGNDMLISRIIHYMETAESRRGKYSTLSDQVIKFYTPIVHILAILTFCIWYFIADVVWQEAAIISVAVLIITCPCALGLAVPIVQVIATGELIKKGVILKSGTALERIEKVNHIIFDKTGTITKGELQYVPSQNIKDSDLKLAASIAGNSKHLLAKAIYALKPNVKLAENVKEIPGKGLKVIISGKEILLGSANFVGLKKSKISSDLEKLDQVSLFLKKGDEDPVCFLFSDAIKDDAKKVINYLHNEKQYQLILLSGDRERLVKKVSAEIGVEEFHAEKSPLEKAEKLELISKEGGNILMIGDGINDAPALSSAFSSASFASASDISQKASDVIFQGKLLYPIITLLKVAKKSKKLIKQNITISFLYNIIAVPAAMFGFVTPIIAAIVMSLSSITVTLNSLRLR